MTHNQDDDAPRLCSACFRDQGLRLYSQEIGIRSDSACPNCHATAGHKLNLGSLHHLAHRYFVWGTLEHNRYGAAPRIQYNEHQTTDVDVPFWLASDIKLIGDTLGVGFFYYGPRLCMIGAVEPLEQLESVRSRRAIIYRIIEEYPATRLERGDIIYRLRSDACDPGNPREYDSPPFHKLGSNRLDSKKVPVLYASPNLQICVHECRVSAEDDVYFATLSPTRDLKLLDLSRVLVEEDVTDFESLDMAVHMLFLAGRYSYKISRALARAAFERGYDGVVYPSYFSLIQTGAMPFETGHGLLLRRIRELTEYEESKTVPNVGIFGYPIRNGLLEVVCINRLILRRVQYDFHFGPIVDAALEPWTTDVGEASAWGVVVRRVVRVARFLRGLGSGGA